MSLPWQPDSEEFDGSSDSSEAWRGDLHPAEDDVWRDDVDELWGDDLDDVEALTDSVEEEEDNSWRGERHFADWPEDMAGPEYWMFKRTEDSREEGNGKREKGLGWE